MKKFNILKEEYGFQFMTSLSILNDRIHFNNLDTKRYTNCIYAIIINSSLKYIGKTKNFYKRSNTYKNSKYWENAFESNKNKTELLEEAVKCGYSVEIWYRKYIMEDKSKTNLIDLEEPRFIKLLNPCWNVQCKDSYYESYLKGKVE